MNLKDFTLLVHANHYRLVDLAISKFKAEKYLNKYLSVSAPGEVAPSLKRSYLELKVVKALSRPTKMEESSRFCTQLELSSE